MRGVSRAALAVILVTIASAIASGASAQSSKTDSDGLLVTFIESTRDAAVVSEIDKNSRTVTLRYPDGGSRAVEAGSEVRNFERIRVGDTLLTEHHRMTRITTRAPQSGETVSERSSITRSSPGEKPNGTAMVTVESAATVESVDVGTRTVVLRIADGSRQTIDVPQNVQGLDKFGAGKAVTLEQTDAIAIAVTE